MTFHPTGQTIGNLPPPLSRANGGTGVTTTPAAPAVFTPGNPGATLSTTLVMMGLGATITYTATSSGKVLVIISGFHQIATAVQTNTIGARFGTGTAPNNGDAVTGTRFGGVADASIRPPSVGGPCAWSFNAVLSLTPNTATWFDIALACPNGAGADSTQINTIGASIVELS